MFARQERVALLLLVSVALIVVASHLVLANLGKQPFARPFTNSSADGELVAVEGQIDQIIPTKSGGHITISVNNLSIFLPSEVAQGVSFTMGDRIKAYGVVQTYRGKKEIVVESAGDIRILPV